MYTFPHEQEISRLTLASLLVAVEEIIRLLLTRPLEVQWEDDEGREEGGPDESAVVDAESLSKTLLVSDG